MKQIQIAAGIIRNVQQEIFITQRVEGSHMAGFWEFPGGKIEPAETPEIALKRELLEETGIVVREASLFKVLKHRFPDRPNRITVLHFYLITQWEGEPFGREGQPGRWIAQRTLQLDDFPPSNAMIINLLTSQVRHGLSDIMG